MTACALSVDPKLMHALVWHQSGGEPWAVSVQGEANPRVYPNMREAIREFVPTSFGARFDRSCRRLRAAVEGHRIRSPAMPQCRDGGRADREADNPVQDTFAVEERCDVLCSRGLSGLLGAAGRQVRDRRRGICCEGRCAELRHAKRHQHGDFRHRRRASVRRRATRRRRHRGVRRSSPQLVKRAVSAKVQSTSQTNPTTTEPQRHQRESRQPRSNQRKRKRKIVVCLCAARSMSLHDDAGRRPSSECENLRKHECGPGGDAATRPTEGKIKGREVRPGWGTVGALFSQAFSSSRRDVNHNCAARTRGNSAIPSTKITPRATSGHDQRG